MAQVLLTIRLFEETMISLSVATFNPPVGWRQQDNAPFRPATNPGGFSIAIVYRQGIRVEVSQDELDLRVNHGTLGHTSRFNLNKSRKGRFIAQGVQA